MKNIWELKHVVRVAVLKSRGEIITSKEMDFDTPTTGSHVQFKLTTCSAYPIEHSGRKEKSTVLHNVPHPRWYIQPLVVRYFDGFVPLLRWYIWILVVYSVTLRQRK